MARTDVDYEITEDFTHDEVEEPKPNNLMEVLRAKREAQEANRFFDLEVPMYDGLFKIRYNKSLPVAEIDKILRKVQKSKNPQDNLWAACDVIAKCTDSMWVRDNDEAPWVRLEDNGVTVTWGSNLLSLLGLPFAPTTRIAVQTLFGNDLAVIATQGRVFQWIQGGLDENSGEEVSGE